MGRAASRSWGPPEENVATSTWDRWPRVTSPGNGSILLPSSEVWQPGSPRGPRGTDTSPGGPFGWGTAFGVPGAGHVPAGWWRFVVGAAVPGCLLRVPLQDEPPT